MAETEAYRQVIQDAKDALESAEQERFWTGRELYCIIPLELYHLFPPNGSFLLGSAGGNAGDAGRKKDCSLAA